MLPGPVFNVELLTTARRARYYVLRFVYGAILLLLVWMNNPELHRYGPSRTRHEYSINEIASIGQTLFWTFFVAQSITILTLTPALVAGTIADERERRTLHYLMASMLSSPEIVLGKLGARMLHVGVFMLVGLPIMSLLSLFGGVDPEWVLRSFIGTISTAWLLSAASIWASTWSKRPRDAIAFVYLLEFAWLFLPTIIDTVLRTPGVVWPWTYIYAAIQPANDWLVVSSPIGLFYQAAMPMMRGRGLASLEDAFYWMVGLQLGAGLLLVIVSVLRLRPIFRSEGEGSWLTRRLRRAKAVGKPARRLFPRPACGDDAMLWKERYFSQTRRAVKIVAGLIVAVVMVMLGYATWEVAKPAFIDLLANGYSSDFNSSRQQDFGYFVKAVTVGSYVLLTLAVGVAAASSLTSERERDTWISLIATPLEGWEIVRGKMVGAVWGYRWVLGLMAFYWLLGLVLGSIHPFGLVTAALVTAVYVWFATAVGVYFSLVSRTTTRAMAATIGLLIFLNGGYLFCVIPLRIESPPAFFGVTPMVEWTSVLNQQDFDVLVGRSDYRYTSSETTRGFTQACVFSVIAYGLAAWAFTVMTIARFDVVLDRPKSHVAPILAAESDSEAAASETDAADDDPFDAPTEVATEDRPPENVEPA
ncbi:MAG: ABC transporter permease subunit [Planctomycetota bacterium]|nr:ABC transporter permease subunit [Planctomycetota bacterium]